MSPGHGVRRGVGAACRTRRRRGRGIKMFGGLCFHGVAGNMAVASAATEVSVVQMWQSDSNAALSRPCAKWKSVLVRRAGSSAGSRRRPRRPTGRTLRMWVNRSRGSASSLPPKKPKPAIRSRRRRAHVLVYVAGFSQTDTCARLSLVKGPRSILPSSRAAAHPAITAMQVILGGGKAYRNGTAKRSARPSTIR